MTGPMSPEEAAIPAAEWTPDAIDRLLQAVRDVPPCEEPDPAELPAEITAVDELMSAMSVARIRLSEAEEAMLLHHDDGEPISDRQRDAVRVTCHNLRTAVARTLYAVSEPGESA